MSLSSAGSPNVTVGKKRKGRKVKKTKHKRQK